jgi:hypothetical protein
MRVSKQISTQKNFRKFSTTKVFFLSFILISFWGCQSNSSSISGNIKSDLKGANTVENAQNIVNAYYSKFISKYTTLCQTKNDNSREQFISLIGELNEFTICGDYCNNLSDDQQYEVSKLASNLVRSNADLYALWNNNKINCWN